MGRPRGLKAGKPDRPLLRSLTTDEVVQVLRAGEIEADSDTPRFHQIARALEEAREAFLDGKGWQEFSLTDRQLADRLTDARNLARQLRAILGDSVLTVQMVALAVDSGKTKKTWAFPSAKPLDRIIQWSEVNLKDLARRSASSLNKYALPPAYQGGLEELAIGLARVWRMATGNEEPSCARGSSMIPFLRAGMQIMRQREVTTDAARKWASFAVKYYFA